MISLEEALLSRVARDKQDDENNLTNAAVLGAGLGGTAGITVGDLGQRLFQYRGEKTLGQKLQPGRRFAGGLVGAILGGALGAGAAQQMKSQSPAAVLLSKLQTNGQLNSNETNALQAILANTYSDVIGA